MVIVNAQNALYVNINLFAQQPMPLTNGIKRKNSIVVGIQVTNQQVELGRILLTMTDLATAVAADSIFQRQKPTLNPDAASFPQKGWSESCLVAH